MYTRSFCHKLVNVIRYCSSNVDTHTLVISGDGDGAYSLHPEKMITVTSCSKWNPGRRDGDLFLQIMIHGLVRLLTAKELWDADYNRDLTPSTMKQNRDNSDNSCPEEILLYPHFWRIVSFIFILVSAFCWYTQCRGCHVYFSFLSSAQWRRVNVSMAVTRLKEERVKRW